MNKLYRLPLRTRGRNVSSGVRRRQNSSKILATGIIAFFALAALVAIGFATVFAFKHLTAKPKTVAAASPSPSAATPAIKTKDVLMPLVDPNQTPSEASASAHAAISPQPSPPVPPPTAAPTPAASPTPQQQKTDSQPKDSDRALTKTARKSLEKKRLEAERKRARLEKMYQNHEISIDAYNKGKEEYKEEIQKYRTVIKSGE